MNKKGRKNGRRKKKEKESKEKQGCAVMMNDREMMRMNEVQMGE